MISTSTDPLFTTSTSPLKETVQKSLGSIFDHISTEVDRLGTATSTVDSRIELAISRLTEQQNIAIVQLESKLTETCYRLQETENILKANQTRVLELEAKVISFETISTERQQEMVQLQSELTELKELKKRKLQEQEEEAKKNETVLAASSQGKAVSDLVDDVTSNIAAAQLLSKHLSNNLSDFDATLNHSQNQHNDTKEDDLSLLSRYLTMSSTLRDQFSPKLAEYGTLISEAQRKLQRAIVMQRSSPDMFHHNMEEISKKLSDDAKQRTTILERLEIVATRLNVMFQAYQEETMKDFTVQMESTTKEALDKAVTRATEISNAGVEVYQQTNNSINNSNNNNNHNIDRNESEEDDESTDDSDFDLSDDSEHMPISAESNQANVKHIESTDLPVNQAENNKEQEKKRKNDKKKKKNKQKKGTTSSRKAPQKMRAVIMRKVKTALDTMKSHMDDNHMQLHATIDDLRQSTLSMKDNLDGIFGRLANMELKQEVLDNAEAAAKFERDQMKLWKQDMQDELNTIRQSIPEASLAYDDSAMQTKLQNLASKATVALLNVQDLKGATSASDLQYKAALEEQAAAIAHLISSKADLSMMSEQFADSQKSGDALEESIRIFMKQVANNIDERDYRSGKIASCERAELETRMLRLVTSSLRRLRRQQTMLAQALPQTGRTSLMGVVYKCLACDQAQPDVLSREHQKSLEYLRRGESPPAKGRPSTAPHHHVDFQDVGAQARRNVHIHSPYKVKGAGFRVSASSSR